MKFEHTLYQKPLSMTGFGGGAASLSNAGGGAEPLFNFNVGAYYDLRPGKFGSYGMAQSNWQAVFGLISAPWHNVAAAQVFVTHPQENSRGNPAPGVIFGITGFPSGVYEFTLDGGSGADADPGFGAPGGRGMARMNVRPEHTLYFVIGQGGIYTGGADRTTNQPWYYPNPGGWNGGGAAGAQNSSTMYSGSGGGSTDIRLDGTALSDRIMVAGGGGGATDQNYMVGGAGGGFNQNGGDGGQNGNSNGAKGGTTSAGGSGALYNGTLYETYMNGALWSGGRGYDGSQPVASANAAGGGGGGYYGGGGAVDESGSYASGSGGGSGYANTSVVFNVSGTVGGAANGNPSWTANASSVNGSGRSSYISANGNSQSVTDNASDNSEYQNYQGDGGISYINNRYGGNGKIRIDRIS